MNRATVFSSLVRLSTMITRKYNADCCIAATRIALDVCEHFGIEAAPMVVSAYVANDSLWKRMRRGTWDGRMRPGNYSVGIGFGYDDRRFDPAKAFNGHLVLVAPDPPAQFTRLPAEPTETILDLSLSQMARPAKGIHLTSVALALPLRWRTEQWFARFPGCHLSYSPLARPDRDFLTSPDWTKPLRRELSDGFIEAITDLLPMETESVTHLMHT